MHRLIRSAILTTAVAPFLIVTAVSHGQSRVWNGNAADDNWSTAANWSTNTAPPLVAGIEGWRLGTATLDRTTIMDNSYEFGQLQFNANSGYSINNPTGGDNTLTLRGFNNGQTILNVTAGLVSTINVDVVFNDANNTATTTTRVIDTQSGDIFLNGTFEVDSDLSIQKNGAGRLYLNGANTLSNTFTSNNGDVYLGTNTSLGNATITKTAINNNVRFLSSNTARTLANNIVHVGQGSLAFTATGGPGATLNGSVTLGAATNTFGGGDDTTTTLNGNITGNGTDSIFSKATATTYIVNGNITGASVNHANGSLTLNGNQVSSASTVPANVVAGGTLAVNGLMAGNMTVGGGTLQGGGSVRVLSILDSNTADTATGGTLSIGDALTADTFNAGRADFGNGGNLNFTLADASLAAGTGWDLLTLDGNNGTSNSNLAITVDPLAAGGAFTIAVNGPGANFNEALSQAFTIVSAADITGYDAGDIALNLAGFTPSYTGTFSLAVDGGNLNLVYTAVPEPGSLALLALGGLILRCRRAA